MGVTMTERHTASLLITLDLFVELLKALKHYDGQPRYFAVVENPLPEDVEVERVETDGPHLLRLTLSSVHFPAGEPELPPTFCKTVYVDEQGQ